MIDPRDLPAQVRAHGRAIGLGRNEADRARHRPRTIEGSLGTAQHFHTLEVVETEVRAEPLDRNRRLVEIEPDSFLYFGLILVDAPGRNAAHEYLRTRPIPAHRQAGRLARDNLDPVRPELAELGTPQRADAGGPVLNRPAIGRAHV